MKARRKKRRITQKDSNRYPKGLNRKKVQELIAYYEKQPDEEGVAEINAAPDASFTAMVSKIE